MAKRVAKPASPFDPGFTGEELIVVLCGPESFLQAEHIVRLREAIAAAKGCEVESIRVDGPRAQLADVLDELRSFGLMRQHKMVVVADAEEFVKRHRAALERYAESPVDSATLVLRDERWNKGNLDKLIEKVGRIVRCEPPDRPDAESWLRERAKQRYGVGIDRDALAMLIDHMGVNLGLLDSELGKLAVAVPAGGSVAMTQVKALAGHASDEKAWEIQEALLGGDPARAVAKLHELIDLADQPEEVITFFVADLVRKLHHAAVMAAQKTPDFTICSTLKVWPKERQGPFMSAARRLGRPRAARLLAQLVETDRRAKSGLGDLTRGLEAFCLRFTAALKP